MITVEQNNELELYLKIKSDVKFGEVFNSSLMFNYYYYNFVYSACMNEVDDDTEALKCVRNFIIKTNNLSSQIAIISGAYEVSIMLDKDNLLQIMSGKSYQLLNLNSDAAKIGALMALVYKLFGTQKLDLLTKTLFLT